MRILVAGAAGFVGRAVVHACSRAGHEVRGIVRSREQFAGVVSDGGTPFLGDLLKPESLKRPSRGCDVVIHLAQASHGSIAERRRVRVQGGRNLVAAAVAAGVPRCVIGSGYWVYRDNPRSVTERSPVAPLSISKANFDAERVVRRRIESVTLRPGMIYGPGSWFAEMVAGLRAGSYAYIGSGSNFLAPVHWQDAGEAFRTVCERWVPGETYLVVDDRPARTKEFADFVSKRLGVAPAGSISFAQASKEWGKEIAILNRASRRASNRKLRALGWKPRYRTFRTGVPTVLAAMPRV
ncbi:MAG: NAD-dependent epimerase/dehydratase family protein [Thermoplasmata archaeon]